MEYLIKRDMQEHVRIGQSKEPYQMITWRNLD